MSIDKDEFYADEIYEEPAQPINPNTLIALHQLAFYTEDAKNVPRDELDKGQRSFSAAMQDHLTDLLWGRAQFVKFNDLKIPPMADILKMFHKVETALLEVELAVSPVEIYEYEHTNAFGFFHSMVSVYASVGDKEYVKKKPVALWEKVKAERSVIVPMHQAYDLAHTLVMARQEVITREHRLNLEDNPHRDQWTSKSKDFIDSSPVILEFFTQAVGVHKLAKKVLHEYLQSFRWHDIQWGENVLDWSHQKDAMYEVLGKKQEFFKRTFWLSDKDFTHPLYSEGMKPAETLLALGEDGELIAGSTKRVDGSDRLQIHIRPQRQFNQGEMVPAPLENSLARNQTMAEKREEIDIPHRDCIELDSYISLSDQKNKMGLYIKSQTGWIFHQQPPQMIRIIRHLYDIRTSPQNSLMVKQLAEKFTKTGAAAPSISRKLKALKEFCKKQSCKEILVTTSDGKWTLNSTLDCCSAVKVR